MKLLGIDEAGRGPVIGPMIIAGVMIQDGKEVLLGAVKDSKLLTHKKRIELNHLIQEHSEFKIIEVSPKEIDAAVDGNDKKNMNLNWLEAYKQAEIINEMKPDVVIIDCPHPIPKKFEDYLRNLLDKELKDIKLIVEHKADVNYPVCSAASIIAKVRREEEVEKLKEKYGDIGPGYPANAVTQKFIKENWNKHPEIFRHSWSTFKNHAKMKGQKTLG
ncbi:MAG: ribonuclease HII [Candidatus Nanoarchaeia archaeon]|nr:ribonuclease HII [Candidatus Nanoarchaeia archaeon]